MRPRSRALTNAILVVLSTFVAVLVVEAAVRVIASGPMFGQLVVFRGTATRYVDGVPLWSDTNPRYNADDVRKAASDRGSFKIIGLGDSVLYGSGVTKEETYLEQTRRLLERRSTRPVEILNLAVQGYNTMQEAAVYAEIAGHIKPDIVLVHYWADDAHQYHVVGGYVVQYANISEADGRLVARALPLPARVSDFLLVHSRLYGLLTQVVMGRREPEPTDWTRVGEALADIQRRVQSAGGRLLVLASPRLDGAFPEPNDDLRRLKQHASRRGIEVIDLDEWFPGVRADRIALDGCHFNPEGHRLIAERFAEYLLDNDLSAHRKDRAS
jgi:hypothetical protein